MTRGRAAFLGLAALALGGCAQPGPFVPLGQAAKLGVATSRITTACGTAEELTAFGGRHAPGLSGEDSIAISGVRKLIDVYDQDQSDLYQGESVGDVVHDSISLLGSCGLGRARRLLVHALTHRPH